MIEEAKLVMETGKYLAKLLKDYIPEIGVSIIKYDLEVENILRFDNIGLNTIHGLTITVKAEEGGQERELKKLVVQPLEDHKQRLVSYTLNVPESGVYMKPDRYFYCALQSIGFDPSVVSIRYQDSEGNKRGPLNITNIVIVDAELHDPA